MLPCDVNHCVDAVSLILFSLLPGMLDVGYAGVALVFHCCAHHPRIYSDAIAARRHLNAKLQRWTVILAAAGQVWLLGSV